MTTDHLPLNKIPLSAYDAFYWYACQTRSVPFSLVLQLRQRVTVTEVVAAVQQLLPSYPLLQAKVVDRNQKLYFVCQNDPIIPVRAETEPTLDWRQQVNGEMSAPFPLATGPYLRMLVGHHTRGTYLITTCLHLLADAMALVGLLSDLCHLLTNPRYRLTSPCLEFSMAQVIDPSEQARLVRQAPADLVARFSADPAKDHVGTPPPNPQVNGPLFVAVKRLSQVMTQGLIDKTKEMGVTIQAALSIALAGAVSEVKDLRDQQITVVSPVNLRERGRTRIAPKLFRNLHTVCIVPLRAGAISQFWSTTRQFDRTMNAQLAHERLMMISAIMQELYQRGQPLAHPAHRQTALSLVVSNLGKSDTHLPMPPMVDAIYGPAVNAADTEIGLGIVTHRNQMAWLLAGRQPAIDHQQEAEAIIACLAKRLQEALK